MQNLKIYLGSIIFTAISFYSVSNAQVSVYIDAECEVSSENVDICISGDWYNKGDFISLDSRLIFNGTDNQSLSQPTDQALDYLQVNKNNGSLILTDSLKISDSLSIVRGKISSTDNALLILLSLAESNEGDSVSFVDGPMAKVYPISITPAVFTYPTGANMDYRPVSVSLASVADDSVTVTVKQINQNAQDLSTNYLGIDNVSSVRYWQIRDDGVGKFTGAQITLSYDSTFTDDGVEIGSELRIVQLDTSATWVWNDIGGSGSANYKGTIQSTALSDLQSGYFTFGDASGGADITLPVFLTSFNLSQERGVAMLKWKTASEFNNQYWLVQKRETTKKDSTVNTLLRSEADSFVTIAQIKGQGTASTETEYAFSDNNTCSGSWYDYRLVDVSYSGRKHFHTIESILVGAPLKYKLFQNYPNPFNPYTTILFDLPLRSDVRIDIYNVLGQKVTTLVNEEKQAGYYKHVWNGENDRGNRISSGMYILTFQAVSLEKKNKKSYSRAKKMFLVK